MTIFDILAVSIPLVGARVGWIYGFQHRAVYGGYLGGFTGFAVGLILARLPLFLALRWAGFERKTSQQHEAILESDQYYIYHLALENLMSRGEDVSKFKPRILALLQSEDPDRRRFGWNCLQLAFPPEAEVLAGFRSNSPRKLILGCSRK